MEIEVQYDNYRSGMETRFSYFSKFNRVNAKGISEEVKKEMVRRYGSNARNYEIVNISRVEEL